MSTIDFLKTIFCPWLERPLPTVFLIESYFGVKENNIKRLNVREEKKKREEFLSVWIYEKEMLETSLDLA